MEEAAKADDIIIIDRGRIITSGTPFELKEQYASDKLKLYRKGEVETITLKSTMEAIPILQKYAGELEGFEVIQGNMDDVFVNVVGKELDK